MTPRTAFSPLLWLPACFNLLLAALQVFLLVAVVGGGRSVDSTFFRVDALNVTFGVAWTLALGLGLSSALPVAGIRPSPRLVAYLCLFFLALLALAYAREPILFVIAWEIVGLALWLSLREMAWPG